MSGYQINIKKKLQYLYIYTSWSQSFNLWTSTTAIKAALMHVLHVPPYQWNVKPRCSKVGF